MHLSLLRSSGTTQDRFGEAMVFGRPVTVPVLGTETLPRVNHFEVGKQRQQLTRFEIFESEVNGSDGQAFQFCRHLHDAYSLDR